MKESAQNADPAAEEASSEDASLLSPRQLTQLEVAVKEVSQATGWFSEYVRKTVASSSSSSAQQGVLDGRRAGGGLLAATTPRGKRMLPASPETSVVTPAMNTAHMRRINMMRTISLASQHAGPQGGSQS